MMMKNKRVIVFLEDKKEIFDGDDLKADLVPGGIGPSNSVKALLRIVDGEEKLGEFTAFTGWRYQNPTPKGEEAQEPVCSVYVVFQPYDDQEHLEAVELIGFQGLMLWSKAHSMPAEAWDKAGVYCITCPTGSTCANRFNKDWCDVASTYTITEWAKTQGYNIIQKVN